MFFYISKIFWMVFQPLTLIALLIALGITFFKYRLGRIFTVFFVGLFLLLGFFPVGSNLVRYLENIYPVPQMLPEKVDGIIILGGAMESGLSFARGQVQFNDRAERVSEMLRLYRLYPHAKIVFSGGDASMEGTSGKESTVLRSYLNNIGFDTSRIVFEEESRNTYENYLFSFRKVHPQPGENWLLVTSAFHMPRSAAIFTSNDWAIIPYPAGFLTAPQYDLMPNADVLGNYYMLQVAAKEIIGIIAYTLTERIR